MYQNCLLIAVVVELVIIVVLWRKNRELRETFKANRVIAKINSTLMNVGNRLFNHLTEVSRLLRNHKRVRLEKVVERAKENQPFNPNGSATYKITVSSASHGAIIFEVNICINWVFRKGIIQISDPNDRSRLLSLPGGECASYDLSEDGIARAKTGLEIALVVYDQQVATVQ